MRNEPDVRLSREGERRRREIQESLVARAERRRAGMRTLAGAGGVCVLAVVGVAVWAVWGAVVAGTPQVRPGREVAVRGGTESAPPAAHMETKTGPAHEERVVVAARGGSDDDVAAHIRVVRNEPLPTRACGKAGGGAGGVCLLDDAGLLRALAETGGSYGIVRVNGRVEVVSNREEGAGG